MHLVGSIFQKCFKRQYVKLYLQNFMFLYIILKIIIPSTAVSLGVGIILHSF